jgi:CheY-like chemotaxis protein
MPHRTRVLVVDDNAVSAESMAALLRSLGYNADWAANGGSAFVRMGQTPPYHFLIIDYLMPDMTGLDVLRKLRDLPAYARTPVLLLTASGECECIEAELQNGLAPACCVAKPVDDVQALALRLESMRGGAP